MKFKRFLLLVPLVLAGCANDFAKDLSSATVPNAVVAQNAAKSQGKTLKNLKGTVDGLTPGNLDVEKPKAQQGVADATTENATISKSLAVVVPAAKKDASTIASSTDPVKVRLNEWALAGIGLGVLGVIIALIFGKFLGDADEYVIEVGVSLIAAGLLFYGIASLLHTIHLIVVGVFIAALVGGGVWAALHWASVAAEIKAVYAKVKAIFVGTPVVAAVKVVATAAPVAPKVVPAVKPDVA